MKSTFLFFFIPLLFFSQNIRFTYNYRYLSDTLKKDDVSNENVVLDFYNKERRSIFTGLKHIISDSVMVEELKKGIRSFPDGSTKIRYVVEKLNNGNLTYFYTPNHMPDPVLKVKEERKMNWKITNEHDNILGYTAQKATTYFAGRQWTAWFTSDISIPDGPYKFQGLPGLILKISDKTSTHSFEIISVQKRNSGYLVLNDDSYKDAKLITLEDFKKIPDNPFEAFKRKALSGGVIFHTNEEKQNFLKDMDLQIKESKIHDNNPIELSYEK